MSSLSPVSLLDLDLAPDKPPLLHADPAGDAPRWVADQRDALRAVVAEHGSLLVRGLGLHDATELGAVFRQLATGLMTEREAFASRRSYSDGIYSSANWPQNQPMCMHHELSYTLEFPGLMLFACLSASSGSVRQNACTDRSRRSIASRHARVASSGDSSPRRKPDTSSPAVSRVSSGASPAKPVREVTPRYSPRRPGSTPR